MVHKVHQYQRRVIGKDYVVYACGIAGCTHYIPETLLEGKQCLCNRCKKSTFTIKRNREGGYLHKPHCEDCTAEPKNPRLRSKRTPQHIKDAAEAMAALLQDSAGDD